MGNSPKNIFIIPLITNLILIKCESPEILNPIICGKSICSYPGGICLNNKTCVCSPCFTTRAAGEIEILCNYQQKSSLKAVLIELFFPFGIGHFYLGNLISGFIKMFIMYFLNCCVFYVALGFVTALRQTNFSYFDLEGVYLNLDIVNYLKDITSKIILIIIMIDQICLILEFYKDGNGMPLC